MAVTMALVTVSRVEPLCPGIVRVTLNGPEIGEMDDGGAAAGAKIFFPAPGHRDAVLPVFGADGPMGDMPVNRSFTIRRLRRDECELEVDFGIHGDGPSTQWAERAKPGYRLGIAAPRIFPQAKPDADWYLVGADPSGFPAACTVIDALPPGARVNAWFEVPDAAHELPGEVRPGVKVEWLHRHGREAGSSGLLEAALRSAAWPSGSVYAWFAGEAIEMASIRSYVKQRRVPRPYRYVAAYWRRGVDESALEATRAEQREAVVRRGNLPEDLIALDGVRSIRRLLTEA
jgi:NADPH-dependent ferric siderophore reductase